MSIRDCDSRKHAVRMRGVRLFIHAAGTMIPGQESHLIMSFDSN